MLASVTVIARQPQPVFPDAAKHMGTGVNISANLGYIQLIRNLRVVPGFYNADFKFTISQPTTPWITIAIAPPGPGPAFDPADVVRPPTPLGHFFNDSKYQYHLNVMPLTPNTLYYYIITAASSTPNDPPATKTGSFTTTLRTAMVYFDSVRVWRDGDPNANGELKFTFGVFDGVTRQYLGPSRGTKDHPIPPMQYPAEGWADLGDGDFVELHRGPVIIDNAPTTLTLWVNCEDYDGPVDPTTWGTLGGPGSFPEEFAPGKGSGDYDAGEWAAAQEDFNISFGFHGGLYTMKFDMTSPQGGVWFTVSGRIEISNVTFAMSRSTSPKSLPSPNAFVEGAGKIAAVASGADSGRLDMFTLGPDGAVYHKPLISGMREKSRSDWQNIGHGVSGSVTALSLDNGRLHVLGLNQEGNVLHKYWNGEKWAPSPDEWKNIGGKFGGQITAVSTEKGCLDLFAIDSDAQVYHKTLNGKSTSRSRSDWENIGGKIQVNWIYYSRLLG